MSVLLHVPLELVTQRVNDFFQIRRGVALVDASLALLLPRPRNLRERIMQWEIDIQVLEGRDRAGREVGEKVGEGEEGLRSEEGANTN